MPIAVECGQLEAVRGSTTQTLPRRALQLPFSLHSAVQGPHTHVRGLPCTLAASACALEVESCMFAGVQPNSTSRLHT